MFVKGVGDLDKLPEEFVVQEKKYITLEEGLTIQEELIQVYSEPIFVRTMQKIQRGLVREWDMKGAINTKDYNDQMRTLLADAQAKVLPKYGYPLGIEGILKLQGHMAPIDPMPEVQRNVQLIN